jgi:hypothetical protein
MLTRWSGSASSRRRLVQSAVVFMLPLLVAVCACLPLRGDSERQDALRTSSSAHRFVVLLDVNPNQKKVLPVEISLAEGVIQKLGQPGNTFSVITFGSKSPTLLKSGVQATETVAAVRDIGLGEQSGDSLSVELYDALNLAFGEFTADADSNSLLIITEGNDGHDKMFKQALIRAQQLQVICNVAMVANHPLYGSKAIQRYGFYLRKLAGKTHGRYIEVGDGPKRVRQSTDRFSENMLGQYRR